VVRIEITITEYTPADTWGHPTRTLTNPAAASDLGNMEVGLSPTIFERAADVIVPGGGSYTPTVAGLFSWHMSGAYGVSEYYSSAAADWKSPMQAWLKHVGRAADFNPVHLEIGDGSNYRIHNPGAYGARLVLMRMG